MCATSDQTPLQSKCGCCILKHFQSQIPAGGFTRPQPRACVYTCGHAARIVCGYFLSECRPCSCSRVAPTHCDLRSFGHTFQSLPTISNYVRTSCPSAGEAACSGSFVAMQERGLVHPHTQKHHSIPASVTLHAWALVITIDSDPSSTVANLIRALRMKP